MQDERPYEQKVKGEAQKGCRSVFSSLLLKLSERGRGEKLWRKAAHSGEKEGGLGGKWG